MAQNLKGVRFPGLPEPYLIPQIDPSLTRPGFSADAETTGKALADRLPATHLNAETQHVADEADFNAKVIELYNTLLNGTIGRYCFSINGAIWFVSIYKADIDYGVFEMVQYSASGVRIRHASMFEGAFTGWVNPMIDGSPILRIVLKTSVGAGSYTHDTSGQLPNFYILHLKYNGYNHTITVPTGALGDAGYLKYWFPVYMPTDETTIFCTLEVKRTNSDVTFTTQNGTISYIEGYAG